MSGIGNDPADTADALDAKAEFAAADLIRDLDKRLSKTRGEVEYLRKVIAHLLIDVMQVPHHVTYTEDIERQNGRAKVSKVPDHAVGHPRTIIRVV